MSVKLDTRLLCAAYGHMWWSTNSTLINWLLNAIESFTVRLSVTIFISSVFTSILHATVKNRHHSTNKVDDVVMILIFKHSWNKIRTGKQEMTTWCRNDNFLSLVLTCQNKIFTKHGDSIPGCVFGCVNLCHLLIYWQICNHLWIMVN